MLMSLFSVFDPVSFFKFSINWIILLLIIVFSPYMYYLQSSKTKMVKFSIIDQIKKMLMEVSESNRMALVFVCVVTFLYLAMNNLLGLFPYIFSSTAHPMITMSIGFVMWVSFFLMGWVSNFKESAAHLVPEGSPLELSPFMVILESISHLIRPFTLSIRLAANIMAGHLILGLLSMISTISWFGFVSSIFIQSVLLMLEFMVAVIQGFVFSILLLLYALEYYY